MILFTFLIGCSNGNESNITENNKDLKKDIFTEIFDEKDLVSYVLKVNSEVFTIDSNGEKITNTFHGIIEETREDKIHHLSNVYHSVWKDDENSSESEQYIIDGTRFFRENNGSWDKELLEEVGDNREEKNLFVGKEVISSESILKPLKNYYKVSEIEDAYILNLESNSDNIDEIKKIIFKKEDNLVFGELTLLKAEFYFNKDNYYPISFKWEAEFLDKDNKITGIKQSGNYEEVNKLEDIKIPVNMAHLF